MKKERRPSPSRMTRMSLIYVALFVFILFAVYALTHIVAIALQPGAQPLSTSVANLLHATKATSSHVLFFDPGFLRWLGSSSLVAFGVTVTGVAIASTAGYALSRFNSLGWSAALDGLVTQMAPTATLLLPIFFLLIRLSLLSSYCGVFLVYAATALPFCIWQMKGCYDTIPFSLEEATGIEGATRWQTFRFVLLPLAAPAMLVTALFSFLVGWNEYVIAAIRFQDVKLFTLPPGFKLLLSNMDTRWGWYGAGALLVSIIVVILFLILSPFLVSSARSVEVKG
jgi:arabinogalactan oligomer / maltooligosaccharide transport system permease protein